MTAPLDRAASPAAALPASATPTGAAGKPRRASARGIPTPGGAPRTPAGAGLHGADTSAAPAGSRTWTLELPAGMKLLSLNDRSSHWAQQHARAKEIRKAAWAVARQAKIPPLKKASIIVEYQPPPLRRRRDNDNIPAVSGKHAIDGIVDAKVLPDDEAGRYVTDIRYRIGEPYPKGRLVLHIAEVSA